MTEVIGAKTNVNELIKKYQIRESNVPDPVKFCHRLNRSQIHNKYQYICPGEYLG